MTDRADRSDVDVDEGPAYAAACGPLVQALGGGFMISPEAKAFAKAHEMRGMPAYVLGRGSVLGDVDADVVTAAFGFFAADVVRTSWEAGRAALDVQTAREEYAEVCRAWGRARLARLSDPARLAELLGWVVDGADVAALPLYAGWRAVSLPDDDLGRVAQQLHVLREYRGGLHLVAIVASGLSPLQAVLSSPGGSAHASFYGWEEPFEDVSGLAVARSQAEELTDRLVSPSWDVLGHDEREELLELLVEAHDLALGPSAA